MEKYIEKQNAVLKEKLDFNSLLKPNRKYDLSSLKRTKVWEILKENFFSNIYFKEHNQKNKLSKFIQNNNILGVISEIFSLLSDEVDSLKELTVNLFSNAFSKFDDRLKLDISITNEILYDVAKQTTEEQSSIEINNYFEKNGFADFQFFEFKNLNDYEFSYQWKRINAVINYYFTKISQAKLGRILSLILLISYESQKELQDFISSSLISNENLSEDFVLNKQNELLRQVFDNLEVQQLEETKIKEIIVKLVSIVPSYQVSTKHESLLRKFFPKRRNEKFQLFLSDDIITEIGKDLKLLSIGKTSSSNAKGTGSVINLSNKDHFISSQEIASAKSLLIKSDKIDYLSALSETYFKSNKLSFNKYKNQLVIIKLACLAYGYSLNSEKRNAKHELAKNLFEKLMLKHANVISPEFYENLEKELTTEKKDSFIEKNIPAEYAFQKNMHCLIKVINFVYKNLKVNSNVSTETTRYYLLKNEIFSFESEKKTKSILSFEGISVSTVSKWQNDIIGEIENTFKKEKSSIYVRYLRFMTETYGKLYLSDKPIMTTSQKIGLAAIYLVLSLWVLIIILPILQVLIQAFNWYSSNASTGQNGQNGSLGVFDFAKFKFSAANFDYLFEETKFTNWLVNSLVISIISMSLMVCIVALIGYAFSRFRFKGKKVGLMTVMLIQMVPTISSFVAFYIMLQILQEKFGITGQMMLILIYIGGGIPGNVFVLKGYMDNISMDIDEAAKIDGCGNWTIFTRIMVPLAKPMLSVIALWSFIGPFGDVLLPQVLLVDISEYTMATGLRTLLSSGTTQAQGAFAAGSLIVAVPIAALFLGLQKNITGGLSAAGVKG